MKLIQIRIEEKLKQMIVADTRTLGGTETPVTELEDYVTRMCMTAVRGVIQRLMEEAGNGMNLTGETEISPNLVEAVVEKAMADHRAFMAKQAKEVGE